MLDLETGFSPGLTDSSYLAYECVHIDDVVEPQRRAYRSNVSIDAESKHSFNAYKATYQRGRLARCSGMKAR